MTTQAANPQGPDLSLLAERCSRSIVQGEPLDDLLTRIESSLDVFFPPPPHGALHEECDLRRRLLRVMVRAIWQGIPHPELEFALPKLPEPGRNERCHCGSGRKYKVCCQALAREVPIRDVNFLPSLLAVMPRKYWKEMANSRIDPSMVAHTVGQWLEEGEFEIVVTLLEPWFASDSAFVGQHEFLLDALLDAYSELGNPRKKSKLLERAMEQGDRTIRAAAMQRQVSVLVDQGKFNEAWSMFNKAQQIDPDSPGLAHLEVATLMAQGREQEARTRADFWSRRLARAGHPELSGLVDWLREVAQRGSAAIGEIMAESSGAADLLAAMQDMPTPKSMYDLDPVDGDAGPLTPKARLVRAMDAWRQRIDPVNYSPGAGRGRSDPAADLDRMIALLEDYPELWHSFEALAEMAYSARALDFPGVEETVILPLLQRAESLLEIVLEKNEAASCQLEWGFWENRPALDLLAWRIGIELDRPATPEHVQRLERLLQLNPHDNQGMRMPLSRRYLETGRFEDALALAERYPNDLPEMHYNHALALFALDRSEEAREVLDSAAEAYPKILEALLKSRMRRPKIDPTSIQLGGDDEAWIYREEYRTLWQRLGALKWARQLKG